MVYSSKQPLRIGPDSGFRVKPRLIIHGGAGNVRPDIISPDTYRAYRHALLTIVSKTNTYMTTPKKSAGLSTALETATYAVTLLENNPLFNSGHGAVFTRDGINELEASVMVSRGFAKRGVGVMGLRRVKNPILLAKKMLESGDDDLWGKGRGHASATAADLDVPSAQGHTQLHGETAEKLAEQYGLELVEPLYFFTQARWDEHIRALEREKSEDGQIATWHPEEYFPQGTVGAVALDETGVLCAATSTGGLTNKLTGRIGDTPSMGAGFWAEEWEEDGDPSKPRLGPRSYNWSKWQDYFGLPGPVVELSSSLKGLVADCLPTLFTYSPVPGNLNSASNRLRTTRSMAVSGTGNGDSFLRTAAVRSVAAIARYAAVPTSEALYRVSGKNGELQISAGDRWGKTGEGEGGMIGIECVIARDIETGKVVEIRGEVLDDRNCAGMWRAWIDEADRPHMLAWDGEKDDEKLSAGVVE